jgi:hypothetical protein
MFIVAHRFDLGLTQVLDLYARLDATLSTDLAGSGPADTIDRRQCNLGVLVWRYVYSGYTGHLLHLQHTAPNGRAKKA